MSLRDVGRQAIDAKLNRSSKTKFFAKQSTPLLSTGQMPAGGYSGLLVPTQARTRAPLVRVLAP